MKTLRRSILLTDAQMIDRVLRAIDNENKKGLILMMKMKLDIMKT